MNIVHDPPFLKTLTQQLGVRSLARCHIEVMAHGPEAGFQIDICDRRRTVVSLGWSPAVRDAAYILGDLNADRIDEDRLTTVVRQFLEDHGHWTTADESLCVVFRVIRTLEEAIKTQDWSAARRAWGRLTPWHSMLMASNPSLAYVATVLANNEALAQSAEDQSTSIH